jgi:hypothetical protein
MVKLAFALVIAVSAVAAAGPPPFQGHLVLGTVGITARDHYPAVGAFMDRLPGDDVELASAFRNGDAVIMKVLIFNFGEESHNWTVRGSGAFHRRVPGQVNQPPITVSHDVLAAPVTHTLGPNELREFDLVVTGVPDYVLCGRLNLDVIITGPFVGEIS